MYEFIVPFHARKVHELSERTIILADGFAYEGENIETQSKEGFIAKEAALETLRKQ